MSMSTFICFDRGVCARPGALLLMPVMTSVNGLFTWRVTCPVSPDEEDVVDDQPGALVLFGGTLVLGVVSPKVQSGNGGNVGDGVVRRTGLLVSPILIPDGVDIPDCTDGVDGLDENSTSSDSSSWVGMV